MSGLQAADTVKQQAVQLASSKSQAASALAAQKAAEQVSPSAGMQSVWSAVLKMSPVTGFMTKLIIKAAHRWAFWTTEGKSVSQVTASGSLCSDEHVIEHGLDHSFHEGVVRMYTSQHPDVHCDQ